MSLYWHAQAVETLLPSGKRNPAAGIMLALLAEIACSEVETLRERINSGLAEARRKGVKLGRPEGTALNRGTFLKKHQDIVRHLKSGQSVRNTAKCTEASCQIAPLPAASLMNPSLTAHSLPQLGDPPLPIEPLPPNPSPAPLPVPGPPMPQPPGPGLPQPPHPL